MVLTHVEPSDIHGPESLMEVGGNSYLSSSSACENKSGDSGSECTKFSLRSSSDNSSNPLINKDSNATADESGSIKEEEISGSVSIVPDSTSPSSQLENFNSSNQNISKKLIFESPLNESSTAPAISVQLPTPSTTTNFNLDSKSDRHESTATTNSVLSKTTLNSDSSYQISKHPSDGTNDTLLSTKTTYRESQPRRHTSTPKRSGSRSPIPPLMNDSNGLAEDVFENDSNTGTELLDKSCSESPISMKLARRSGIRSGELYDTLLTRNLCGLTVFNLQTFAFF